MDIAAETTTQVLLNRRLALLAALTDQLASLDDPDAVAEGAASVLRDNPLDFNTVGLVASDALPDTMRAAAGAALRGDDLIVTSAEGVTALYVPLALPSGGRGSVLRAEVNPHLIVEDLCRWSLRLLAATVTQAFDGARARQTERRLTVLEQDLSYKLQHSLLTEPARPDHLQVAVRYQAATEQAHIVADFRKLTPWGFGKIDPLELSFGWCGSVW